MVSGEIGDIVLYGRISIERVWSRYVYIAFNGFYHFSVTAPGRYVEFSIYVDGFGNGSSFLNGNAINYGISGNEQGILSYIIERGRVIDPPGKMRRFFDIVFCIIAV